MEKINGSITSVTEIRRDFNKVLLEISSLTDVYIMKNNRPQAVIIDYHKRLDEQQKMKEQEALIESLLAEQMRDTLVQLDVEPVKMQYNEKEGYFEPTDYSKKKNNSITEDW